MHPFDDKTISDGAFLIRKINPDYHLKKDGKGGLRLSSGAFSASSIGSLGMSVEILDDLEAADVDLANWLLRPPYLAAVKFCAGLVRQRGYWVGRTPLPNNPYHADVWKPEMGGRFSRSFANHLAENAEWLFEPM